MKLIAAFVQQDFQIEAFDNKEILSLPLSLSLSLFLSLQMLLPSTALTLSETDLFSSSLTLSKIALFGPFSSFLSQDFNLPSGCGAQWELVSGFRKDQTCVIVTRKCGSAPR